MGNSAFEKVNLKQARRLLSALSDLACESSLTGSLEKGTKVAVRQYNGLLDHLTLTGAVPEGLFTRLDEDEDSFYELGVACILLNAYIEQEDDTPPAPLPSNNIIVHSDSQELQELRELLHERRADK